MCVQLSPPSLLFALFVLSFENFERVISISRSRKYRPIMKLIVCIIPVLVLQASAISECNSVIMSYIGHNKLEVTLVTIVLFLR